MLRPANPSQFVNVFTEADKIQKLHCSFQLNDNKLLCHGINTSPGFVIIKNIVSFYAGWRTVLMGFLLCFLFLFYFYFF